MDELIDVLDKDGNKTGQIKTKKDIKKDGDYHRAITVLILNDDKILMQKRSSTKIVYPNLWSLFIKGHVKANETSLSACIREIKEEIGISVNTDELDYLYTIKEEKRNNDYIENIFYDAFILRKNIDLKDIVIDKEEVADVSYISIDDAYQEIKDNNCIYAPNDEDYQRIFEYLRKTDEKCYVKTHRIK